MLHGMGPLQIVLAVVGIGFLIAWHELGHYTLARLLGMRVLKYSIGFGPRIAGFRWKDIDYQVAALPLGGFVQIKGMTPLEEGAVGDPRSFIMRPRWARWLVLAAGPGFNYLMAAVLFFLYLWVWPSPVASTAIEIGDVDAGKPAAAAGLESGDLVVAVDGQGLDTAEDFRDKIVAKNGAPVLLQVVRGQQQLALTVTPVFEDGGPKIGVRNFSPRHPRVSLVETVAMSVGACETETVRTLEAFGALFRREPGVDVGSPVQIVAEMKGQIAHGARQFVWILALLSVNLGLLNLLPVPSLDGIKMLFLTVEGAIRKDLHAGFQVWVNALGLVALLGLMVVLMARDTLKLLG